MRLASSVKTRGRAVAIRTAVDLLPTQPSHVFYSSWGGQFSDSPRAIFEELVRQGRRLHHTWRAVDGRQTDFPTGVNLAVPGTRRHLRALGEARYVITNTGMVGTPKPRGTMWVQTWHGTPLKRIGFDMARGGISEEYEREIARWDVLISPNPFSTPIFRKALRFEGVVLETGYPRNDALLSPDRHLVAERVRRSLGLDDDVTAILYTPTFRDEEQNERGELTSSVSLDLGLMAARLAPEHVLLVRRHSLIAPNAEWARHPFVIDVTDYPDIRDLYLASDVMVTDYSSTMFDFALTGKPMLFYTYDLESYRDRVRGFYFDFEQDAPGPLVGTTEELVDQLIGIDAVQKRYSEAYEAFKRRFCPLDDGDASARVIRALFG